VKDAPLPKPSTPPNRVRRRVSLEAEADRVAKVDVVKRRPTARVSWSDDIATAAVDALSAPFDSTTTAATRSCKGFKAGEDDYEKFNQDRACVCNPLGPPGSKNALFGIFDGHGPGGEHVSQFAAQELPKLLETHAELTTEPGKALGESLLAVDDALRKRDDLESNACGCTAVVVLFLGGAEPRLIAANVGNSRAVLGQRPAEAATAEAEATTTALALTADQSPADPNEKARLESAGHHVQDKSDVGDPARVFLDSSMSGGGLAVPRTLGDHAFSSAGLVAEPVISTHTLSKETDNFLLLASDGVWDVMQTDELVPFLAPTVAEGAMPACEALCNEAVKRWASSKDYQDDISVVCVRFDANVFTS